MELVSPEDRKRAERIRRICLAQGLLDGLEKHVNLVESQEDPDEFEEFADTVIRAYRDRLGSVREPTPITGLLAQEQRKNYKREDVVGLIAGLCFGAEVD